MQCAAETVAIGTQALVDNLGNSGKWVMLQVDVSNAFNSIAREPILLEAQSRCPSLFNYLRFAYSQEVPLFCGHKRIMSTTGTHQGCPLAPVGFAVGIQPILEKVSGSAGSLMWNSWYLDDGQMMGDPQHVVSAYQYLQGEFALRGLTINAGKCQLWGPGAQYCAEALPGVTIVPWEPGSGIRVLGAPVNYPGSVAKTREMWDKASMELGESLGKVTKFTDTQCAHHLLRKCLDGCKMTHLLRASDSYGVDTEVKAADEVIIGAFEDIVGCGLDPCQRAQAGLPLSVGGCGVRQPSSIRPAARIAALAHFYAQGGGRGRVARHCDSAKERMAQSCP